jgi:hypothetical protein
MKTYEGSGGTAPPFLTSALDGGEWSVWRPCRFTHGEGAPGIYWILGWVGPRVRLDAVEKRNILRCRELNPGRPARCYTDWAIPTLILRDGEGGIFEKYSVQGIKCEPFSWAVTYVWKAFRCRKFNEHKNKQSMSLCSVTDYATLRLYMQWVHIVTCTL